MKPNIHPQYNDIKVVCSCGHTFVTRSTLDKESLSLEVCAKCHPFYTGTQKLVDTAGRVDRFRQKYGSIKGKDATPAAPKAAAAAAEPVEKVEAAAEPVEKAEAAPKAAAAPKKEAAPKAKKEKVEKKDK